MLRDNRVGPSPAMLDGTKHGAHDRRSGNTPCREIPKKLIGKLQANIGGQLEQLLVKCSRLGRSVLVSGWRPPDPAKSSQCYIPADSLKATQFAGWHGSCPVVFAGKG
jgi:hypothetical protein